MTRMAVATSPKTLPILAATSAAAVRGSTTTVLPGLSGVARRALPPRLELSPSGSSRALIPATPIILGRAIAPSHQYRHRAERRQPIASYRGCINRGPSRRATGKALEEAREAMEGVWFPIMGLDRLAEAVLSGRGDSTMVAELVQGVRRLPHLLRPAHRLLQDLCEAESEDTGQLVFQLPGAGRRCA